MISGNNENPYSKENIIHPLWEVPLAALRLSYSFSQRAENNREYAQECLDIAINIGVENQLFDVETENSQILCKIGAGFNTSAYLFNMNSQDWVLKIGAQKAPVPGWFNPCSLEYAQWYARNLNIIHSYFTNTLPYLIPWPQYVMHAEDSKNNTNTLIIQPYIKNRLNIEDVCCENEDVKKSILHEILVLDEICRYIYDTNNIMPDFGSKDNISYQEINGEHHLVMVDNGMIDFEATSPILNTWSRFIYNYRIKKLLFRLKQ